MGHIWGTRSPYRLSLRCRHFRDLFNLGNKVAVQVVAKVQTFSGLV
jgi:hypothetical protein